MGTPKSFLGQVPILQTTHTDVRLCVILLQIGILYVRPSQERYLVAEKSILNFLYKIFI